MEWNKHTINEALAFYSVNGTEVREKKLQPYYYVIKSYNLSIISLHFCHH